MHWVLVHKHDSIEYMRDKSKIKRFGCNLCAERNRLKLSQDELGHKAGDIDGTYIGRIERGEINPTLTTIIPIIEALNIPFETLIK